MVEKAATNSHKFSRIIFALFEVLKPKTLSVRNTPLLFPRQCLCTKDKHFTHFSWCFGGVLVGVFAVEYWVGIVEKFVEFQFFFIIRLIETYFTFFLPSICGFFTLFLPNIEGESYIFFAEGAVSYTHLTLPTIYSV